MTSENSTALVLPGGRRVVVLDPDAKGPTEDELQRNVLCLDERGDRLWRVAPYGGRPGQSRFLSLRLDEEGRLIGYNFDTGEYLIDTQTGRCTPLRLLK